MCIPCPVIFVQGANQHPPPLYVWTPGNQDLHPPGTGKHKNEIKFDRISDSKTITKKSLYFAQARTMLVCICIFYVYFVVLTILQLWNNKIIDFDFLYVYIMNTVIHIFNFLSSPNLFYNSFVFVLVVQY